MDCCTVDDATATCPSCGVRGRKVGSVTLESLVPGRTFEGSTWKFCRTTDCAIAYYNGGNIIPVDAVCVVISQKTTAASRPVCYCFGHSARDIEDDHAGTIAADIKERCRRGEDRCPETNPQGSCCLGNVLALTPSTERA
jgi:uncharacterized protein with PIN domain